MAGSITNQAKQGRRVMPMSSLSIILCLRCQNDRKKFNNPASFSFLDEFEGGGFFHGSVEVVKVGINVMTSARNDLQM